MSGVFEYRGYKGSISYSPEDGCFFGEILGIPDLILFDGETLDLLEKNFFEAVDDYIDNAEKEHRKVHKPCSGSLNVRLGEELHTDLAKIAQEQGKTLNSVIKDFCLKEVQNYKTGTRRFNFSGISINPNRQSTPYLRPNNAKVSHDYEYPSQSLS